MTAPCAGHLRKDPDGVVRGILRDACGTELHLTATRTADGYDLTATVRVPDCNRLPWEGADAAA